MTQTYHVAYHMMRLAKSNSLVPVTCHICILSKDIGKNAYLSRYVIV